MILSGTFKDLIIVTERTVFRFRLLRLHMMNRQHTQLSAPFGLPGEHSAVVCSSIATVFRPWCR